MDVDAKEGGTAFLKPEPEQESPHESHERQLFISSVPFAANALEPLGAGPLHVSIGLLQGGDPRTAFRVPLPALNFEKLDTGLQFYMTGGAYDQPQFLEILRPGLPSRHMALLRSLIVIKRRPVATLSQTQSTDKIVVDIHLQDSEADLLLYGLGRGYLQEAAQALRSEQITAEKLLQEKGWHPFGAAVGAYSLLQFGELDRLHNWTENLMKWFPWFPDGLAIHGEHLARVGKHQEALQAFADLPLRGIPQFSLGLSYAVNRLKLYTRTTAPDFDPNVLDKASTALRYLEEVGNYTDFREPVLTTEGIRNDAKYPQGIELDQYF